MMDSSTFKRFTATLDNILENQEDVDLTAAGKHQVLHKFLTSVEVLSWKIQHDSMITLCPQTDDDEIPEELLLGKHQLSELGSDSAKIKAMGIFNKVKRACLCAVTQLHSGSK